MPLNIRLMLRQDISQVSRIDREAFPTDWPPTNFPRELENRLAFYIVACESNPSFHQPDPIPPTQSSPSILSVLKRFFTGTSSKAPVNTQNEELILGYAGMWILADEAHVTSIASRRDYRRKGIGEALLMALVEMAMQHNVRIVTLEARISNTVAQNLYLKYGFQKMGVRKGYYLDNREDAVIMSTEYIGSPEFRESLNKSKEAHALIRGSTRYEIEITKNTSIRFD